MSLSFGKKFGENESDSSIFTNIPIRGYEESYVRSNSSKYQKKVGNLPDIPSGSDTYDYSHVGSEDLSSVSSSISSVED